MRQTESIVIMTKEGSTKIVTGTGDFVLGHGHVSYIVIMPYFFSLLYFGAWIRQIKF